MNEWKFESSIHQTWNRATQRCLSKLNTRSVNSWSPCPPVIMKSNRLSSVISVSILATILSLCSALSPLKDLQPLEVRENDFISLNRPMLMGKSNLPHTAKLQAAILSYENNASLAFGTYADYVEVSRCLVCSVSFRRRVDFVQVAFLRYALKITYIFAPDYRKFYVVLEK